MILDCAIYQDGQRRDGSASLEQAYHATRDGKAFGVLSTLQVAPKAGGQAVLDLIAEVIDLVCPAAARLCRR